MDNTLLKIENSILISCSQEIKRRLIIPEGVTSIAEHAFSGCSHLRSITLPAGVESIEKNVFSGCKSLMEIYVSEKNPYYSSYKGVLFDKDRTVLVRCPEAKKKVFCVPDTVKCIEECAFSGCHSLRKIILPDGLTDIKGYAFEKCRELTELSIPDSVRDIGEHAFENCVRLKDIKLSDGITSINENTFYNCRRLMSVTIPENVADIKGYAFEKCINLTDVKLPDSVKSIGMRAFEDCRNLVRIIFPGSLENIGGSAFSECYSLEEIALPDSVECIAAGAFSNCRSLVKISFPDSVKRIDASLFEGCNKLTSIIVSPENHYYSSLDGCLFSKDKTVLICCSKGKEGEFNIPDGVKKIEEYAFDYCRNLTAVKIPDGVLGIGNSGFRFCENLVSITIPGSIEEIGNFAFKGCGNLVQIIFLGDMPESKGFEWLDGNMKVTAYYPSDNATWTETAFENYGGVITWVPYTSASSEIEKWEMRKEGTVFYIICNSVLVKCSGRISGELNIPEDVTEIGDGVFRNCRDLKKITIPSGVKTIGKEAFECCQNLVDIVLPDSLKKIEDSVFEYCMSLRNITIPDSVTYIGKDAFYNCTNLADIKLPSSWKSLDAPLLIGCRSLKAITLPDHLKINTGILFSDFPYLTSINASVNNEYYSSSDGCLFNKDKTVLIRVPKGKAGRYIIPDSVKRIEDYAFSGCKKMISVTIPGNVRSIGNDAFYDCSSLEAVTIENGVSHIGDFAFSMCTALKEISFPESVNSIGENVISHCRKLVSVSIPEKMMNREGKLTLFCPEYRGKSCVSGENKTVNKRELKMRVFQFFFWGNGEPEKGKILQAKMFWPFFCEVGETFSLIYNKCEYVSAKLIKYWKADMETAFVWAEVVEPGHISSFVKPLNKEERYALENKENMWSLSPWDVPVELRRINESMFYLTFDIGISSETMIFMTDSDGIDHLIGDHYYDLYDSIDEFYIGDYAVGFHRQCPYLNNNKPKMLQAESSEEDIRKTWKTDARLRKKLWKNDYYRRRR